MKLTLEQFKDLIENAKWERHQEIEFEDDYEQDGCNYRQGWSYLESTTMFEGKELSIIYNDSFYYKEYESDSFETDGPYHSRWEFNFTVVDEDGEDLEDYEIEEYIESDFQDIDYEELKGNIDKTINLNEGEEPIENEGEYIITCYNKPDIQFLGEKIASVSTSCVREYSDFSGETGRWGDYTIYKSRSGKYICERIDYSQWIGEGTTYDGKVCDTQDEVIEFFKDISLAEELFNEAGIDYEKENQND